MRAHVVDGITHTPAPISKYIYVALQNPLMETVMQVCLKADGEGCIFGNMPLPDDLPKGEYTLCAYTRYMQNYGQEYFFRKKVFIANVQNHSIHPKAETNASSPLANPHPDYAVDFLPEGGNLPEGTLCRIAFKALNEQGQGEPVAGTVRDEKDSIIAKFHTFHRGMGVVSFIPEKKQKCHAVCKNSQGETKRFPLPLPQEKALSLQVNQVKGKIYVKVLHSLHETPTDSFFVFSHQRGWPNQINRWKKGVPYLVYDSKDFATGSVSFMLADGQGRIISERMVFINHHDMPQGTVSPEHPHYGKREKMNVQIQIADAQGLPWNGDCSVAITDNADVQAGGSTNILSSLLLSSDLKGYVEDAAWYFEKEQDEKRAQALDMLMMTQGWRKYDLQQAWQGSYKIPEHLPEQSKTISGKVSKRISGQPVENATVHLINAPSGWSKETRTDSAGRFRFDNLEYPDSTSFWVSAYTAQGKGNVVLQTDSARYPALKVAIPPFRPDGAGKVQEGVSREYLAKAGTKMAFEKGLKNRFLDEVVVTATYKAKKTEFAKTLGAISLGEQEIKQSNSLDVNTLLRKKIAGLTLGTRRGSDGGEIQTLLIRSEPTLVILDGVMVNSDVSVASSNALQEIFYTLPLDDIEQIDLIKGAQSIAYHSKFSNVLAITTKRGVASNDRHPVTNLKCIQPLGHQQPVAFYSPRYDTVSAKENANPDLRTTIFWQPRLSVEKGKAQIECYTTDAPANYTIGIEGTGSDGTLLYMEKQIGSSASE